MNLITPEAQASIEEVKNGDSPSKQAGNRLSVYLQIVVDAAFFVVFLNPKYVIEFDVHSHSSTSLRHKVAK